MAKKAIGRPKTPATPKQTETLEKLVLDVDDKLEENAENQSTDKTPETDKQDLAGKEKVKSPTAKEIELQAEIDKLKAGKVVEVTTGTPKDIKLRPSQVKKQTHTVYVAKKRGDEWGSVQTREMSEPAYNAIAKDLSLKVTLPKNSRLVEPEIKGCKDC